MFFNFQHPLDALIFCYSGLTNAILSGVSNAEARRAVLLSMVATMAQYADNMGMLEVAGEEFTRERIRERDAQRLQAGYKPSPEGEVVYDAEAKQEEPEE